MHIKYKTKGTCSRMIEFDIEDNIVTNIRFHGGCDGNLKAISKILEGARAEDIVEKLSGNTCGFKSTSCADQLANAVKENINK
ncbi:MAG: TIGR03905 family TSCPD domain-containing protein [Ruminococcaceae bacterium]|nr:TIGR03905 family TSCPD domain-containing protein [Oscillospiraceae bacterium]